jgi:hypothetical protein
MSYFITAISNGGGAPEQTYRKLQSAGACPEAPYAGTTTMIKNFAKIDPFPTSLLCGDSPVEINSYSILYRRRLG